MKPVFYAFFLVLLTIISIPLSLYTLLTGHVHAEHLLLLFCFYFLTALGISVGYHRFLSHQAFKCSPWMAYFLLSCGAMACLGPPTAFATLHRQHHAHSDDPKDPHSPQRGFWHAHCLWLFSRYKPKFRYYGSTILKNPIARHIDRFYPYIVFFSLTVPFLLGGWIGLLWAGALRITIVAHLSWLVNSFCHKQGRPRNIFWLAPFTFGESLHLFHHCHPQRFFFSHKWYHFDIGAFFIGIFKKRVFVGTAVKK
jgi:stearoyl-CoA desaturase (Delta-9 desaturase)